MSAALVLAAHGSRANEAQEGVFRLAAGLADALGTPTYAGFLELAEPSIAAAIDAAAAAGATRIVLVPYFLHLGLHVRHDLTAIADAARGKHRGLRVDVTAPLGTRPEIVAILTNIAAAALQA